LPARRAENEPDVRDRLTCELRHPGILAVVGRPEVQLPEHHLRLQLESEPLRIVGPCVARHGGRFKKRDRLVIVPLAFVAVVRKDRIAVVCDREHLTEQEDLARLAYVSPASIPALWALGVDRCHAVGGFCVVATLAEAPIRRGSLLLQLDSVDQHSSRTRVKCVEGCKFG
jgi:hypothetical protein